MAYNRNDQESNRRSEWGNSNRRDYNNNRRDYNRGDDTRQTSSWGQRRDERSFGGSSWSSRPQRRRDSDISTPLSPIEPFTFTKNFYDASKQMSTSDAKLFRQKHAMTIQGNNIPDPVVEFSDIPNFNNQVLAMLNKNYTIPTPIQAQGWPMALSGRDMVGIAQTGSGKTLSFVLPLLIHAADQKKTLPSLRPYGPICLILAPTRELVLQISEVVDAYKGLYNLHSAAVYGGVAAYPQRQALRDEVEILIATPGRLIDLYEQHCVNLSRITFLVLDEADRMLDMGFEPQLKKIIPNAHKERQTLMWSATWPREVRNLALEYMKDFIQVNIGEDELTVNKNINQTVIVTENREKKSKLLDILSGKRNEKVIIFANTKRMCDDLEMFLRDQNYKCSAIHGDKSQAVRDRVIVDFKSSYRPILIATDVAARGLDVKDVRLVVNYDFPKQCEDYVHRIGRTGRGGCEGEAISFFTQDDRSNAKKLGELMRDSGAEVPRELNEMGRGGGFRKTYRRW